MLTVWNILQLLSHSSIFLALPLQALSNNRNLPDDGSFLLGFNFLFFSRCKISSTYVSFNMLLPFVHQLIAFEILALCLPTKLLENKSIDLTISTFFRSFNGMDFRNTSTIQFTTALCWWLVTTCWQHLWDSLRKYESYYRKRLQYWLRYYLYTEITDSTEQLIVYSLNFWWSFLSSLIWKF